MKKISIGLFAAFAVVLIASGIADARVNNNTGGTGGGGAVSSVSNADGSLVISPTTGAVVGSLNLTNPNVWTVKQTFNGNASSTGISANYAQFGGTSTTTFSQSGNIGVGIVNPAAPLSISRSGSDTPLLGTSAGATSNCIVILAPSDSIPRVCIRIDSTGQGIHIDYRDSATTNPVDGFSMTRQGYVGIGTSSPQTFGITAGVGTFFGPELVVATSTAMNIGFASSTQILARMGTAAATITFSLYQALPGMKTTVVTCNPQTTGGSITFANARFSGGIQPGNTTAANQCDIWYFRVTQATSSLAIVLDGMLPGIQ